MMMRTFGTLSGLNRISGRLTKTAACNDFFFAISIDEALYWSWGVTTDAIRFLWK